MTNPGAPPQTAQDRSDARAIFLSLQKLTPNGTREFLDLVSAALLNYPEAPQTASFWYIGFMIRLLSDEIPAGSTGDSCAMFFARNLLTEQKIALDPGEDPVERLKQRILEIAGASASGSSH